MVLHKRKVIRWNFKEEEIKINTVLKGNGIFAEVYNISANFSVFEK